MRPGGAVTAQGLDKHGSGPQEGPRARHRHGIGNGWKKTALFNTLLRMPSLNLELGWEPETDSSATALDLKAHSPEGGNDFGQDKGWHHDKLSGETDSVLGKGVGDFLESETGGLGLGRERDPERGFPFCKMEPRLLWTSRSQSDI